MIFSVVSLFMPIEAAVELARLLRGATPADAVRRPPAATRQFGPRPPVRVEARARRSKARLLLLALPLLVGVGLARLRAGGGASSPAPCGAASISAPAGAQIVRGDTAGVGCLATGVYFNGVLTIRLQPTDPQPRRFALGRSGDEMFLGDWDCDGVETPALFRSSTGATFYYDTWSTNDEPSDDASRCRSIG